MNKITKTMKVDTYVCSDGREFRLESEANIWEQRFIDLEIEKGLTSMELVFPMMYTNQLKGKWFLISNNDTRDYFLQKYVNTRKSDFLNYSKHSKLTLGDWVAPIYEKDDDGDVDYCGLITLAYLIESMNSFISLAKEVTVNGRY